MKKIIVIAVLFCSFSASAQKTTPGNYTYIAQKYEWDAGIFKALGIPSGSGPAAFTTGQVVRAGAIYYDTLGVDAGPKIWNGLAWVDFGGGSQTLQQVFDTEVGGSVLTKSDTINAGSNTLNIIGDGSVVNFAGSLRAKPSYTSNWVASLDYVGNGVSAYGALSFRENSTGGGDVVTLSPPVNVTTSYNIYLPEGNNDDTLATKAYARSVGGGVGNLLVDSIGIAGTDLVVPRNDTLYHRLLKGSTHIGVDTVVSTGEARVTLLSIPVSYVIAASDETTDITTGTAKVTFRMPYAMTVTDVRASVNTVSSSGLPTIDINESGTTILSTKITIDVGEKTSTTAATPPVISDSALADDAEITIDVDVSGTGAKGLKIIITGTRTI